MVKQDVKETNRESHLHTYIPDNPETQVKLHFNDTDLFFSWSFQMTVGLPTPSKENVSTIDKQIRIHSGFDLLVYLFHPSITLSNIIFAQCPVPVSSKTSSLQMTTLD